MKLALEFAALLIFFLCFSTALKAFLHLRHQEVQRGERSERHVTRMKVDERLDRVA